MKITIDTTHVFRRVVDANEMEVLDNLLPSVATARGILCGGIGTTQAGIDSCIDALEQTIEKMKIFRKECAKSLKNSKHSSSR